MPPNKGIWTPPSRAEVVILLWGHYRIVYRLMPNDEVHVIGVFHGAMKLEDYVP